MNDARIKDLVTSASYLTAEVALYPLTTVLTRVQSFYINHSVASRALSSYAGGTSIIMSLPGLLMRVKLGQTLDPYLKSEYNLSQFTAFMIVSTTSDLLNVLLRSPFEHYRQQWQVGAYTSISKFTQDYIGHSGPLSFWRGSLFFFLRDSVFNILRFSILDYSQTRIANRPKRFDYEQNFKKLSPKAQKELMLENLRIYTWCNVFATIPAAIITTPFDVIKTRIMTHPPGFGQTSRQIIREIIKEEGVKVLFRGAGLRAAYISAMISIFTSIEYYLNIPLMDAKRVSLAAEYQENLFK